MPAFDERRPRRGGEPPALIPDDYRPRFARFFLGYTRRLIRRRFHAVRLAHGSEDALSAIAAHPGPVALLMNHASWWDPLTAALIGGAYLPDRPPVAPIDAEQLRTFRFFRWLGLFGVDPDDPRTLPVMTEHVLGRLRERPRTAFYATPQGRFTDPRSPVVPRPGAAAVLARHAATGAPPCRVAVVAVEYAFWQEQRPEIFLRIAGAPAPADASRTSSWHAAIRSAMQSNADELARLVIARDAAAFKTVLGAREGRINPVFDLLLRLRGRSGRLTTADERAAGRGLRHAGAGGGMRS